MSASVAKKHSRARRKARGVRGSGAPRLVAPGALGNPYRGEWAILYNDRIPDKRDPAKFVTRSRKRTTGETAEGPAREFFVRWQNARVAPRTATTVNDLLDDYVHWKGAEHERKGRSPRLLKNIESALREVRAHFGPLAPDEVNFAYVQSYIERRRKMPKETGGNGAVSDRTISIELAYLRSALKRAVKTEAFMGKIPFIELPEGTSRARERILTPDERLRLKAAVADPATPKHIRAFVVIGLKTGQRGQHIRNLRWRDVDFDRGVLWFRRSNPHAAKNKSCEDTLMAAPLAALLHEMKESALTPFVIEHVTRDKHGELAKNARVGDDAKPIGSLKRAWATLLRRANIDGLNIHDLRRSFTSAAADEGAELKEIADFMGVDVKTLRRHYAFSSPERHRNLLEKIEGAG
jgi:integrase